MTYFVVANVYTWWRGDDLPALPPLRDLHCRRVDDVQLLAGLCNVGPQAIETRLAMENNAYVAFLQDQAVAYGWTAAKTIGVADAGIEWPLTPPDRGLWDFATLEPWRGRGIYPRLLQAILRSEEAEAERFWIGHRADNPASKYGIMKAGFELCDIVVLTPDFQPRSVPRGNRERALADPQGRHFGFVEAADSELAAFDFESAGNGPPQSSG